MDIPADARAFDCAEITLVRSGAAILSGEFGRRHVNAGDLIVIGPRPQQFGTAQTVSDARIRKMLSP